ncbi:hypothetical protein PR048_008801 [Dryococelus australis]|uniref:Uncharacterized protein n=1 Tax=Dryococelus australis TaxID=614101 RepID=A0ABQ9HY45_9NEOP|nr:hypothetical protein PR048_008801 [Dryococelus australis]
MVRLLATHLGEPGSIADGVALGFPHVGILQHDAAGRRVSSEISRFPRPCIQALLPTHAALSPSAFKTSMLSATRISSLTQKLRHGDIKPEVLRVGLVSRSLPPAGQLKSVHGKVSTFEALCKRMFCILFYSVNISQSYIRTMWRRPLVRFHGNCEGYPAVKPAEQVTANLCQICPAWTCGGVAVPNTRALPTKETWSLSLSLSLCLYVRVEMKHAPLFAVGNCTSHASCTAAQPSSPLLLTETYVPLGETFAELLWGSSLLYTSSKPVGNMSHKTESLITWEILRHHYGTVNRYTCDVIRDPKPMSVIEVNMEQRRNEGVGETGDPEKTRRRTAASGTIPTCENSVIRQGIEPAIEVGLVVAVVEISQAEGSLEGTLSPEKCRRSQWRHISGTESACRDSRSWVVPRQDHGFLCVTGFNPAGSLQQVVFVMDDDSGQRVFSAISRFPPLNFDAAPFSLLSPSLDLKTSQLRVAQISQLNSGCEGPRWLWEGSGGWVTVSVRSSELVTWYISRVHLRTD